MRKIEIISHWLTSDTSKAALGGAGLECVWLCHRFFHESGSAGEITQEGVVKASYWPGIHKKQFSSVSDASKSGHILRPPE